MTDSTNCSSLTVAYAALQDNPQLLDPHQPPDHLQHPRQGVVPLPLFDSQGQGQQQFQAGAPLGPVHGWTEPYYPQQPLPFAGIHAYPGLPGYHQPLYRAPEQPTYTYWNTSGVRQETGPLANAPLPTNVLPLPDPQTHGQINSVQAVHSGGSLSMYPQPLDLSVSLPRRRGRPKIVLPKLKLNQEDLDGATCSCNRSAAAKRRREHPVDADSPAPWTASPPVLELQESTSAAPPPPSKSSQHRLGRLPVRVREGDALFFFNFCYRGVPAARIAKPKPAEIPVELRTPTYREMAARVDVDVAASDWTLAFNQYGAKDKVLMVKRDESSVYCFTEAFVSSWPVERGTVYKCGTCAPGKTTCVLRKVNGVSQLKMNRVHACSGISIELVLQTQRININHSERPLQSAKRHRRANAVAPCRLHPRA